ncbi:MAG: hypothetical protein UX89_C0019G0010 [Parcubacteria group bacterium GW2011_GWA2_47_16]|nr:MAG: hypothetical protein UX89_C0019G0010 [Parcubacteria group bacterium GW2011_GWA2_47_16]
MKKIIIGVGLGVLILAGVIFVAQPNTSNNGAAVVASNGTFAVEESSSYDFGSISMAAGKVTRQFKVRNTGAETVIISKMYTSCMCTNALLIKREKRFGPYGMPGHAAVPIINVPMEPNEEVIVEVVFDPAAHGPAGVGRIQREVILENNAGQPVKLQFSALVKP